MKIHLKKELPLLLIVAMPFIYLAYVWADLPNKVPLHWNIKGEIDRWGDKQELILIPFLLPLLTYIIFLFVPIIEEGLFDGEILNSTMEHYFRDLDHPDGIILGCTHFPLIADAITDYFDDNVTLIHSGEAIVEYLESHYEFKEKHPDPKIKFFASENPEALRKTAHDWLDLPSES